MTPERRCDVYFALMSTEPVFNFKDPALRSDPYPLFARLRGRAPIVRVVGSHVRNGYFVTRYADVQAVLKDPRLANDARNVGGKNPLDAWWLPRIFTTMQDSMLKSDPPKHRRLRALVQIAFTPKRVRQLEARAAAITEELLDRAEARGRVDLIKDLALPLPLTVISEMMGIPEEDRPRFRRWMTSFTDSFSGGAIHLLMQIPTSRRLLKMFDRLIEIRRRDPGDDLISALVAAEEDGDRLDSKELVSMVFLLLLAGHETTVNLIATGTLDLLCNPDQLEQLRAHPEVIDLAIEELLRFGNPLLYASTRFAREDFELCGQRIPQGTTIFAGIASANRDPAQFDDPDTLRIDRTPNKHLALGFGAHYCLGAPLARMEGSIALLALLRRFPRLRLAQPASSLRWRLPANMRGLEALPVALT